MNRKMKSALGASMLAASALAAAQVTFYEHEDYRGRALGTARTVQNFDRYGFNDRASSAVVEGGRWLVCTDARFEGQCVVLRPGSYDSLRRMGLNDRVSSARPFDNRRQWAGAAPEPLPAPSYEFRRRPSERLYEAPVTSVRAVIEQPDQRCWIERQQVSGRGDPNVGGAIAGAIIGGILGHQVGGGSGKDIATAGGAVAGAAIGANTGRRDDARYRDVQRCERVTNTTPAYWDVSYHFRGVDHRVQMAQAPGDTVTVNARGEPRG